MRWAQKQRAEFIANHLRKHGAINRRDLIGKFGISTPQASIDLRNYMAANPTAVRYDLTRKAYVIVKTKRGPAGRDIDAAAKRVIYADNAEILTLATHDPSMFRDVAAAFIALAAQEGQ